MPKKTSTRASLVRRAGISGLLLGGLVALASGSCADLAGANFDIADASADGGGDAGADAGGDAGNPCLGATPCAYPTELDAFPRAVARSPGGEVAIGGGVWNTREKGDVRWPFVVLAKPQQNLRSLDMPLEGAPVPQGGGPFTEALGVAYDAEDNLYVVGFFYGRFRLRGLDPIESYASPDGGPGVIDGFVAKAGSDGKFGWLLLLEGDELAAINAVALDPKGQRIFSAGGFNNKMARLVLHKGPPPSPGKVLDASIETSIAPDAGVKQSDVVVIAQDTTGRVLGVTHLKDAEPDGVQRKQAPLALAVSDERIALVGFYEGRLPYENPDGGIGTGPDPGPGMSFGFVAALARDAERGIGELRWAHGIGTIAGTSPIALGFLTYASDVAFLGDSIVVVGGFRGTLEALGYGCENRVGPVSETGAADVFVAMFDLDGNCKWMSAFGGSGDDLVDGLAVHPVSGEIFVHGTQGLQSSMTYIRPSSEHTPIPGSTSYHGFILRLTRDGQLKGYREYDRGVAPFTADRAFLLRRTAALQTDGAKRELLLAYPRPPVEPSQTAPGRGADAVLQVFDADFGIPPP